MAAKTGSAIAEHGNLFLDEVIGEFKLAFGNDVIS